MAWGLWVEGDGMCIFEGSWCWLSRGVRHQCGCCRWGAAWVWVGVCPNAVAFGTGLHSPASMNGFHWVGSGGCSWCGARSIGVFASLLILEISWVGGGCFHLRPAWDFLWVEKQRALLSTRIAVLVGDSWIRSGATFSEGVVEAFWWELLRSSVFCTCAAVAFCLWWLWWWHGCFRKDIAGAILGVCAFVPLLPLVSWFWWGLLGGVPSPKLE